MHPVERVFRGVGGAGLLSLMWFGPVPGWGLVGLVGLAPLATSSTGSCPLYWALGLSTAHDEEEDD